MNMNATIEQALANKILDEEVHAPLLRNLDNIASSANIPVTMMYTSMIGVCSAQELDYVRGIRKEQQYEGLVYVGESTGQPIRTRMMVVAATLLRNFINAKVMTMQEVIGCLRVDKMPRPSVLLIPNFFEGGEQKVPDWQVGLVLDMLYTRGNSSQHTFLYVSDMQDLKSVYSEAVYRHLTDSFRLIGA